MSNEFLDPILHQPVRTRIMTHLANVGECDYTTLKKELELTDGHMSTHMKKLVSNEYVYATKQFIDNKPLTTYGLTKKGHRKFKKYIEFLKELISQ